MIGADERAAHPEGPQFSKFWDRLLLQGTGSCFERDVLRALREQLWTEWKKQASAWDEKYLEHPPADALKETT